MFQFRLNTKCLSLLIILSLFAYVGCGSGDPDVGQVPVKVIIKVDGDPMEEVAVTFVDGAGNYSLGRTDQQGVAQMRSNVSKDNKTIEVKGVLPGDYQVSAFKTTTIYKMDSDTGERAFDPVTRDFIIDSLIHHVPERYSSRSSSGLTASVKKGEPNEFTFELTSQ